MKTVGMILNLVIFTMFGYVFGYHQGQSVEKEVDNSMAIRYAVLQAINYEGQ